MEYEALVAICLWPEIFWLFRMILGEKCLKMKDFSIKFLHHLKFSAFSVPQSDAYHFNWKTFWVNCTTVGFDSSFYSERTFLGSFLPKVVINEKNFQRLFNFFTDMLSKSPASKIDFFKAFLKNEKNWSAKAFTKLLSDVSSEGVLIFW